MIKGRKIPRPKDTTLKALISIISCRFLRPAALQSTISIFRNFFLLQYRAAALPRRYRVTGVDHPLDLKIPFKPQKVKIYADFLWVFARAQGFLIQNFKKQAGIQIKNFIESLGAVYSKAAEVYKKNFSTTKRPKYLARFEFIVIHTFDPHLMCIPSLHVMVVILAYTRLQKILRDLGAETAFSSVIKTFRQRALEITEAVLYIKQHSINCISAAMYAMTCFDDLFPQDKAETFAQDIFIKANDISHEDGEAIRNHIIDLYRRFLSEGRKTSSWEKPLLDFLGHD